MAGHDYPVQPVPSHHGSVEPPAVPPGPVPPGMAPPGAVPPGSPEDMEHHEGMASPTGATSTAVGTTSGTSLAEGAGGMSSNERNVRLFFLMSLIIVSIVVFLGIFIVIIGPDRNDIFTETPKTTIEEHYVPVTRAGGRIYFETNETDSAVAAEPNTSSAADSGCVQADNLTQCVMPVGRTYVCALVSTEGTRCLEWDASVHCTKSPRFTSMTQCMDACFRGPSGAGDATSCPPVISCPCSGDFRLTNWVFEPVGGCRRLNDNHCVGPSEGFSNATACNEICADDTEREFDSRCNGSFALRECTFMDRRYRFFWDDNTGSCRSWEKTTCLLGAYEDYESCAQNCS